jgi:DNA-directed RNA polymerase III subunit RPC2
MGKQAIGAIALNQFLRTDTVSYLMVYPQKPLVQTKTIELVHYDKLPAGHNASVAIMSYSGYDIEDAIIINKGALDRGFGRIIYNRRHTTELLKYSNVEDRIVGPVEIEDNKKRGTKKVLRKHRALDVDGIAKIGEKVYFLKSNRPIGLLRRCIRQ